MHLSIFSKVAAMMVASIAAVIIPVFFATYSIVSDVFSDAMDQKLSVSAFTLEERLNGYKHTISALLWQATRRDDLRRAVADKDMTQLPLLLTDLQSNSTVDMITLSDSEGKVIMRSHSPRKGDSVAKQINVRQSLAGVPLTVGYEGGTAVAFSIRGGSPIYYNNKLVGVLTLGIRLDLQERVEKLKQDLGAEVTFFKGNKRIATTIKGPDGKNISGSTMDDPKLLDAVLGQGTTFLVNNWKLAGQTYTVIYRPLKSAEGANVGMLFLGIPSIKMDQALNSLMMTIAAVACGVGLLMGLIAVVVARLAITRPLARVSGVVSDLVDNKVDLTYRLDTSSRDEVAKLAHQVNRLIGKVETMLSDIEGYKNLVNAIPDPVFAVDEEYRLILANTRMAQIARVSKPEELIGKNINEVLRTHIYGSAECPMRDSMVRKGRSLSKIFSLPLDGVERQVRGLSDVIYDVNGKPMGYLQILSDVTDMVEKEKALAVQMDHITEVNHKVTDIAADVNTSARDIQAQTNEVRQAAERQNQVMSETLNAISQMNETVTEIARAAASASSQAKSCREQATQGEQTVNEAMRAIASARALSDEVNKNLGLLGSQAEEIGQVLNVITDIADQTNLLALNAAIEAARAGDAGRGFAVVADEVRKLAEKTMGATQEVRKAVTDIQRGTSGYIEAMRNVSEAVDSATALSENSGHALREIVGQVSDTSLQADAIATAAEEQSAASEQIAGSMRTLAELADNTLRQSQETVETMRALAALADNLQNVVK